MSQIAEVIKISHNWDKLLWQRAPGLSWFQNELPRNYYGANKSTLLVWFLEYIKAPYDVALLWPLLISLSTLILELSTQFSRPTGCRLAAQVVIVSYRRAIPLASEFGHKPTQPRVLQFNTCWRSNGFVARLRSDWYFGRDMSDCQQSCFGNNRNWQRLLL